MSVTAYKVVEDLEAALAEYTGAPYVVTVTSCTMALLLAFKWCHRGVDEDRRPLVEVPVRTYVSVPMSLIHAGYRPIFRDYTWYGMYRLNPLPVWDSARMFTSGMYDTHPGDFICLSFHMTKTLGDTQGGAILTDNKEAAEYFKRMRFDGRTQGVAVKDDEIAEVGYHCYMSPDVAARLLFRLSALPRHNVPLPGDDYPYLPHVPAFRGLPCMQ